MKKLLEEITYKIWAFGKKVEFKHNPILSYAFLIRHEFVYRDILKNDGFTAVVEAHEEWLKELKTKVEELQEKIKTRRVLRDEFETLRDT